MGAGRSRDLGWSTALTRPCGTRGSPGSRPLRQTATLGLGAAAPDGRPSGGGRAALSAASCWPISSPSAPTKYGAVASRPPNWTRAVSDPPTHPPTQPAAAAVAPRLGTAARQRAAPPTQAQAIYRIYLIRKSHSLRRSFARVRYPVTVGARTKRLW